MSIDEMIRATSYVILSPCLGYLGMVAHNRQERWWSFVAWLLAVFFLLLMVGLVLLRAGYVVPVLVRINTGVVVALTVLVGRQTLHYLCLAYRERRGRRCYI